MSKAVRRYVLRAASSFGGAVYRGTECSDQSVIASRTRQQPASRSGQAAGRSLCTEDENPRENLPHVLIGRDQALGVELAKRNMKRPSVGVQRPKTVQGEMDTFSKTNAGGSDE